MRIDYEEGDTESTYFSNQPVQGQKRKKAPFFKYSKKRKGYGNAGSNSKGSVVSHFKIIITYNIHLFITETVISSSLLSLSAVVWLGVDTAPTSQGHRPLQARGAGAQQVRRLPAGDQAS